MAKRGIARFAFVVQDEEGMWAAHHTDDALTQGAVLYYLGKKDQMHG